MQKWHAIAAGLLTTLGLCAEAHDAKADIVTFSDGFETGGWTFLQSNGSTDPRMSGVGYGISNFPRSGAHSAVLEYNAGSSVNSITTEKLFVLNTSHIVGDCVARAFFLTPAGVHGTFQLVDIFAPSGSPPLATGNLDSLAHGSWVPLSIGGSIRASSNWVEVVVTLFNTSRNQEVWIDDFQGICEAN